MVNLVNQSKIGAIVDAYTTGLYSRIESMQALNDLKKEIGACCEIENAKQLINDYASAQRDLKIL